MKMSEWKKLLNENKLNESEKPKKGDQVSIRDKKTGAWIIEYMDSSHIKMAKAWSGKSTKFEIYNIGQLKDRIYYNDVVKWMQTGDGSAFSKLYK